MHVPKAKFRLVAVIIGGSLNKHVRIYDENYIAYYPDVVEQFSAGRSNSLSVTE